jgi:hypothetical protein
MALWRSSQRLQAFQQRLVEALRRLDLRRVPKIAELHELRVRNLSGGLFAQHGIIAKLRPHLGGYQVLPDRGGVLVADDQQNRHAQRTELIDHRLRLDHVV